MFSNKIDVDRHVRELFNKLNTDAERDAKCYMLAKLYFKIKDYESAVKYVNRYITNVKSTAQCQRLLGECYEELGKTSNALQAYRASLELDGGQRDLVLKVCELLCNPELPLVSSQASYWLDRLRGLFPSHPTVFKLKERLLQADPVTKMDPKELENLILSEIMARPNDPAVRIRFLDFLVDTKRAKTAQEQAAELLTRGVFVNHLPWYECLCRVHQAYEKEDEPDLTSVDYQLRKLTVLERRSYFTLQDCGPEKRSIAESSSAVFSFDQGLHSVSSLKVKTPDLQFFESALSHFRGQLVSHLATLKLKRAKSEPGEWPRALRIANPLLMLATRASTLIGRTESRESERWRVQAAERVSTCAHVLLAQAEAKGPQFLQEIHESCGGKWRERAYEKMFYNKEHQDAMTTSCFLSDPAFLELPATLPTHSELQQFDADAQLAQPDSLHHAVWLGVANMTVCGTLKASFRCHVVPDLPLTSTNLNNTSPDTLNQLDVDAFLYAAVFSCKLVPRSSVSSDRPSLLPPTITEPLCTQQQIEWWLTMYRMYTNQPSNSNNSELRLRLRKGIETVRASGNHGLHPKLLVLLAKQLQLRACAATDAALKEALERRVELYWRAAVPLLERLDKHQTLRDVSTKLFDYHPGDWKHEGIRNALEDGRLFLACQLMKAGNDEEAIEAFQALKSPYATYYQALIYKKLALEVMNEGESSEHRSQRVVLLTRARDALRLTEDRLRRPGVSPQHPLQPLLRDAAEEVEAELAKCESDSNGSNNRMGADGPRSVLGAVPDYSSSVAGEIWTPLGEIRMTPHTPRTPSRTQSTPRMARSELFPDNKEMDQLSSQMSQLVTAKDNISEEMGRVRSDLGDVKNLLQDLLTEFRKLSTKLSDRPSVHEDLFPEFPDPEDYAEDYAIQHHQAAARGPQPVASVPFVPPFGTLPSQLPRGDPSLFQFFPNMQNLIWSGAMGGIGGGGLPFSEGQQLPDFRALPAPVPVPVPAPAPDLASKNQVPNVVVTSSDILPAFSRTCPPMMSVTIPPEHVRGAASVPKPQEPTTHAFQIPLPAGHQTPQPPMVLQSPSDKYQARAYDQPTKVLTQTPPQTSPHVTPSAYQKSPLAQTTVTPSNQMTSLFQFTPSPNQKTPVAQTPPTRTSLSSSRDEDSMVETEYDPRPDFQPIVSLPEVEVRTGEENEVQLFASAAKLYVHREGEWKERGRGVIKILHDEKAEKVRVLMRRDQVHKVCANHHILPEMNLSPMTKAKNALVWAAHDYSGEEITLLKFCIKFSNQDQEKDFKYAFNRGREIAEEAATKKTPEKQAETTAPVSKTPVVLKPPVILAKTTGVLKTPLLATPTFTLGQNATPAVTPSPASTQGGLFGIKTTPSVTPSVTPVTPSGLFGVKMTQSVTPSVTSSTKSSGAEDGLMRGDKAAFGEKVSPAFDFTALAKTAPTSGAFKTDPTFKGFEGAGKPLFGGATVSSTTDGAEAEDHSEEKAEEFEPAVEFTPVVPLPDLVEVKTGEEDENLIYEHRAKILRFAAETKEWKEKGVGNVKLLQHPETGKVRILMRREQVHKVCCNHHLNENMMFSRMPDTDKAATWIAQDFSEGEYKPELLAIRFGKKEVLDEFLNNIEGLQKRMKDGCVDKQGQEAKETSQPSTKQQPLSELFKKTPGTWECEMCLVRNAADLNKCSCCETLRPGAQETTSKSEPKAPAVNPAVAAGFSFGIPAAGSPASATTTKPLSTFTFGAPPATATTTTQPSTGFTFGGQPATTATTATPAAGFTFGSQPAPAPAAAKSSPFTFGAGAATGFTFGTSSPSAPQPASGFTFGQPATGFTFGGTPSSQLTFGAKTPVQSAVNGNADVSSSDGGDFKIGSSERFSFTFKKPIDEKEDKSPRGDQEGEHSEEEDAHDLEKEDDTLTFKPVIPLPEKVPLHTGEEDEDVVYCHRAKLYRFTDGEWKERGVGDLKLLKHKETGKVRMLMRREQVLKLCLNHYLIKDIQFLPKEDRAWLWSAADFSEGTVTHEQFCAKFRDKDVALGFKEAMEREQAALVASPAARPQGTPDQVQRRASATRVLFKDDEPVAVYEYQASPEEKEQARKLQLPDNWFKYKQAEPCQGCQGCDADTESVKSVDSTRGSQEPEAKPVEESKSPGKTETPKETTPKTKETTISTQEQQPQTPKTTVLESGQLPKPTETIFGSSFKAAEPVLEKPAAATPKSSVFANFSFSSAMDSPQPGSLFGGGGVKTTPIFGSASGNIFGGASKAQPSQSSIFGSDKTPVFGSSVFGGDPEQKSAPIFGTGGAGIFGGKSLESSEPVFGASPGLSFASLAKEGATSFGSGAGWSTEVKPMFGGPREPKTYAEDDNGEDYDEGEEHDPQFQPIVELPPAIEVRTGEEDEEALFSERAKLYRYDAINKEWKERGVGDMKVLHNAEQGSYRLLLRREQVHKVVCNMRITSDTELKPMPKSSNSWLWAGNNFVESEISQEQLAVRFKLEKSADTFKKVVDDCVLRLRDLSLANASQGTSSRVVEDVSAEESDDDDEDDEDETGEYCEEEEEEGYDDDEGLAIVLSKEGVTLSQLDEDTHSYKTVADNLCLQVLESGGGRFRLILEDDEGVMRSDTRIDPACETAFRVPPLSLMWVAQDMALSDGEYRNFRIDLTSDDDAQQVYETLGAQDLPDQ